jgi:MoxR-like ATPase
MQGQTLRQSFQQLVLQPPLQHPGLNRAYGALNCRRRRGAVDFAPAAPAPGHPSRWALHAVRADQAVDGSDTAVIQLISDITRRVDEVHAATLLGNAYSPDGEAAAAAAADTPLRRKVLASILDLQAGLLERETEVRLLLLAALCGEHLLLLGPPGTAKSELSRRLSKLTGGKYFERLLTRFSVPEELFGPLSMRGLENDLYVRQLEGYLPTAEVAFIDEIFKANSAILNALLTLLNERLFDNG